jgi:hypothetical protein
MLIPGILAKAGLWFLLLFLVFQFPDTARADFLTEGLEELLDDAQSRDQLQDWIEIARDVQSTYDRRIAELEAMRQNREGYLLRGPAEGAIGGIVLFRERELESLFAAIMLESLLGDRPTGPFWDETGANSLARQIATLALPLLTGLLKEDSGQIPRAEVTETLLTTFLDQIAILDAETRDQLQLEIDDSRAELEQIDALLAHAGGLLEISRAPDLEIARAPDPDFLNRIGYYVIQISGSGWIKRTGRTTRSVGYQNRVIRVTDEVSEPTYRSRGAWQYPPGYSIGQIEQDRQAIARESSIRTCENEAQLGVTRVAPNIWVSGPEYELVDGPFQSEAEANSVRGLVPPPSSGNNLRPGSALQWNLEHGQDRDGLRADCISLEADME